MPPQGCCGDRDKHTQRRGLGSVMRIRSSHASYFLLQPVGSLKEMASHNANKIWLGAGHIVYICPWMNRRQGISPMAFSIDRALRKPL